MDYMTIVCAMLTEILLGTSLTPHLLRMRQFWGSLQWSDCDGSSYLTG